MFCWLNTDTISLVECTVYGMQVIYMRQDKLHEGEILGRRVISQVQVQSLQERISLFCLGRVNCVTWGGLCHTGSHTNIYLSI